MWFFKSKKQHFHSELVDGTLGDTGVPFSPVRFLTCCVIAFVVYIVACFLLFLKPYWFEGGRFVRCFPQVPPASSNLLTQIGFYFRCLFSVFSAYAAFLYYYRPDSWDELVGNLSVAAVAATILAAAISFFRTVF